MLLLIVSLGGVTGVRAFTRKAITSVLSGEEESGKLALANTNDDIVLSEIMINAVVEVIGGDWGEWVEIYNKGGTPVDLTGWQIEDNFLADTIDMVDCPGSSCLIPAGGCWVIASTQPELQTEFDNYTNPNQPAVDPANTVFLGSRLGNGLANSDDRVVLRNGGGAAVDCYSWNDPDICSSLVYTGTGDGFDGALSGSQGQSVTNVQGAWFNHQVNGSPYDCLNTADGGPTAVSLTNFTNASPFDARLVLFLMAAAAGVSLVAIGRRRQARTVT